MAEKSNPPRSILAEAADVVAERGKRYGSPMANHNRTAQLWGAYLGVELTAADVCKLNILQKLSRDRHQKNRDNLVDVAGYVENALLADPGSYDGVKQPQGFDGVYNCFAAGEVTEAEVLGSIRRVTDQIAAMRGPDGEQIHEPTDTLEGERVAHDVTKRAFAAAHADLTAALAEVTALRLDLRTARADRERLQDRLHDLTIAHEQLRKFAQIRAACGRPVTTMVDKAALPPVDLKLPMPPTQPPKCEQPARDCQCARCSGGDLRR